MVYQIRLEEPMGSQVNFFLGPNDLRQLASVLSKSGELVFWRADPRTALLQEVTDIVPTYGVDTLQLQLARRADFQQVLHLFSRASSGYSSDLSLYQPVVEFDLPYVAKGYIRSGRVYRQDAYWNPNDEHERKEEEWIRWAKQLFSSVRRSLTKIDGTHSDLPPGRPSFITRVLGFDSGRFRVWQARRARCHQVAQASGALLSGSCCPARNAA
ncbi:hypothetical protein MCELHM10_04207 [Paracoccaceae bacterium]